jgi:hypothetical protein
MKDLLVQLELFLKSASAELEDLTSATGIIETGKLLEVYLGSKKKVLDRSLVQVIEKAAHGSARKENILYSENPHFLFTRFISSYDTPLGLEYFFFKPLEDHFSVRRSYFSTASPVSLVSNSARLANKRIMALFPETWSEYLRGDMSEMPVYYFMNRFLDRYLHRTKPIIAHEVDGPIFVALLEATSQELKVCANLWVSLHEYFHRNCALPLPHYLGHKASKDAGAFEELRADLNAICELPKIKSIPAGFLEKARSYILAERLFHYASNYNPNDDYDAVASQILFESLRVKQALYVVGDRVCVNETVWSVIEEMKNQFNAIEMSARKLSVEDANRLFAQTSQQLGRFIPSEKKYQWLTPYQGYFNSLKKAA